MLLKKKDDGATMPIGDHGNVKKGDIPDQTFIMSEPLNRHF